MDLIIKRVKRVDGLIYEDQDKVDSFNLGVAGYMIKPYLKFVEVVKTIDLYRTLNELPD